MPQRGRRASVVRRIYCPPSAGGVKDRCRPSDHRSTSPRRWRPQAAATAVAFIKT
ncbi:protein FAM63B-like protein [Anopheles sinensis]|uniref:Protein FAM63B-like protein n=1 Tax=Anopheles sinensis TaxID=74873 RepID=A0A084VBI7_ANOSI|nr:protein FAM63B-like protein [Anopheles sinensis]